MSCVLLGNTERQYLRTCKVRRYCLSALQSSAVQAVYVVICRQASAQQILEKVRVLILAEILFADFFNK